MSGACIHEFSVFLSDEYGCLESVYIFGISRMYVQDVDATLIIALHAKLPFTQKRDGLTLKFVRIDQG